MDINSSSSSSLNKMDNILTQCLEHSRCTVNAQSLWFFLMEVSFILLDKVSPQVVFHLLDLLPAANSLNVKQ